MANPIKIKKGLNIPLKGEAEKVISTPELPETFSIKPPDFYGLRVKLLAKKGDEVKAGSPLFYDKLNSEKVLYTSPVSGEIADVIRGPKRKILEVRILADKEFKYEEFGAADPNDISAEEVREKMMKGGLWPFFTRRPFSKVPPA
ncbi:MAG: NADH:ubiquinone reductase (Na(+)-transporting) subunit A, partial [Flavobacteriales bacterium]